MTKQEIKNYVNKFHKGLSAEEKTSLIDFMFDCQDELVEPSYEVSELFI